MKRLLRIVSAAVLLSVITASFYGGQLFITGLSPSMGPGSRGGSVEQIQQRLKNWGYFDGRISGIYSQETEVAVKNFQRNYRLAPTGVMNLETFLAMGLTRVAGTGEVYAQGGGTSNEQLLARAINGEARGEPYEGQVAVGAVIMNRTRDSKFPKTIAGVIYQPGAFTAVSDGQINVAIKSNSTVVKAARDALNGWDPTGGSLYYWNPATATSKWIWSRKIIKKIGKHNFGK